jgi:hypothetical protein
MEDDQNITSDEQLSHEFWKFAERMLPVFQSDAWEGWKPKTVRQIVVTLKSLFNDLQKNPDSESIGTAGLIVWRELEDGKPINIYGFGMEIHGNFFEYPFKQNADN